MMVDLANVGSSDAARANTVVGTVAQKVVDLQIPKGYQDIRAFRLRSQLAH